MLGFAWRARLIFATVIALAVTTKAAAANPMTQWAATPWTALHQWTPLAVNISLLHNSEDHATNYSYRWRLLHITDAHISLGEAVELHQSGTRRMHNAFRTPQLDKHWEKGVRRQPADTFKKILDLAEQASVDAVILGGDIVNFPHNASVHHALQALRLRRTAAGARLPVLYTAGNHDWLVEGLPQSLREQRSRFRREVLRPFYLVGAPRERSQSASLEGDAGDYSVLELAPASNIRSRRPIRRVEEPRLLILALDNSMHEVSSTQAEFVWRQLARGLPTLLVVHVPFMLPDTTPRDTKDVLCGDPRYHHDHDRLWHVERRERWPKTGSSASTLRFMDDLVRTFAAPRGPLIGVLGGHEHVHRADALGIRQAHPLRLTCDSSEPPRCGNPQGLQFGLPVHEGLVQYVTPAAFEGGHRIVEVMDSRVPPPLQRHTF